MIKAWDKLLRKEKHSSTSGSAAHKIFVLLDLADRLLLYSLSLGMTPHDRDSVKAKRLPKPVTISLRDNFASAGMTIIRWRQPPGWRVLVIGGFEYGPRSGSELKLVDEAMLFDTDFGIVKEEIPRMHSAKQDSIVVPVYGGKICVFERVLKPEQVSNFEVFDPTQIPFLWSKLDDPPPAPNSPPIRYPGIVVEAWFVHNHILYISTSFGIHRIDFSREQREWEWEHFPKFGGVTRFPFQGAGVCIGDLCFTPLGAYNLNTELGFTYLLCYPPQVAFSPLVRFNVSVDLVQVSGREDRGLATIAIVRKGFKHGGVKHNPSCPHLTIQIIEVGREQPMPSSFPSVSKLLVEKTKSFAYSIDEDYYIRELHSFSK